MASCGGLRRSAASCGHWTNRGVAKGCIWVFLPPPQKKKQPKYTFYGVKMTSERLFNSFIPPPKKKKLIYHPKQISGYAPVDEPKVWYTGRGKKRGRLGTEPRGRSSVLKHKFTGVTYGDTDGMAYAYPHFLELGYRIVYALFRG